MEEVIHTRSAEVGLTTLAKLALSTLSNVEGDNVITLTTIYSLEPERTP